MRVVLQRVRRGSVTVEGEITGEVAHGFVALVGITHDDSREEVELLARKTAHLRVFEDDEGKMNRSILEVNGGVLVISQFTLYADSRKGRRPSFIDAAQPTTAEPLVGQGKRLDRKDQGSSLRTRARWNAGSLEVGGALNTTFRRGIVTPWYQGNEFEPASFNEFLDFVGFRAGADTLLLPVRVQYSRVEERGLEVAGGATWRMPGGRGSLAAEVHRWRRNITQENQGAGPEPGGVHGRSSTETSRCPHADPIRFAKATRPPAAGGWSSS